MRLILFIFLFAVADFGQRASSSITVVADLTSYNLGDAVRLRLQPAAARGSISIRYAGDPTPLVQNIPLANTEYKKVWQIPTAARTGRYEVDFTSSDGTVVNKATSFAVHRQLAKVISVDLDKTFYTSGDSVNPTIVVRNVSAQPLQNLQVEFEPYTFPWIAPAPDAPPMWKHIVATGLTLGRVRRGPFMSIKLPSYRPKRNRSRSTIP